jgi:hypothetical protein
MLEQLPSDAIDTQIANLDAFRNAGDIECPDSRALVVP